MEFYNFQSLLVNYFNKGSKSILYSQVLFSMDSIILALEKMGSFSRQSHISKGLSLFGRCGLNVKSFIFYCTIIVLFNLFSMSIIPRKRIISIEFAMFLLDYNLLYYNLSFAYFL